MNGAVFEPLPDLAGLVDHQPFGKAYQEHTEAVDVSSGATSQKEFGRGRVFYIPSLRFDGPMPPSEPYFSLSKAFWKRPANWREFLDGVAWTSRDDLPLQVSGPDYLVANLVEQAESGRRFVHLVNFNFKNIPSIENIEIRCAAPQGKTVRAVKMYSPESETGRDLSFRIKDGCAFFTAPALHAYCMIEVS